MLRKNFVLDYWYLYIYYLNRTLTEQTIIYLTVVFNHFVNFSLTSVFQRFLYHIVEISYFLKLIKFFGHLNKYL